MAVDTKYANLPWIARDETDVYETDDLPESEQILLQTDSSSIRRIDITLEDARKKFVGKNLNSDNVDFSDRIREFVNTGYSIDTTEYVMYPDPEHNLETPLQRFQRLQHEVRDLVDDFEQVKEMSKRDIDKQMSNNELLMMSKDLDTMTRQLGSYKLHYTLGDENYVNVALDSDLCGQESREMLEEIERYTSKHKVNDSASDKLAWEKYYRCPSSKELDNAKIAYLNARVQRLQATLGCQGDRDPSSVTPLSAETACLSLVEASRLLGSRSQALKGGPTVDKLETRLVALQGRLQAVTDRREAVTTADRDTKVAEMYGLVVRWREAGPVLKTVAGRLADLQRLHSQAMAFLETTAHLDKGQAELRKSVASHSRLLAELETRLGEHVTKIKGGLEAMQARVAGL